MLNEGRKLKTHSMLQIMMNTLVAAWPLNFLVGTGLGEFERVHLVSATHNIRHIGVCLLKVGVLKIGVSRSEPAFDTIQCQS